MFVKYVLPLINFNQNRSVLQDFSKNVKFETEVMPVRWELHYSMQTDARAVWRPWQSILALQTRLKCKFSPVLNQTLGHNGTQRNVVELDASLTSGFKTASSRWSGCNFRGDAARGHEQFQVPTWGMRALKRKPSWGRYFQNINFQTGIKQNGYSYAFHLWPINR